MRLVSFNINGIRARLHQLEALVDRHRPAVIGLQETKVQDSEFPVAAVEALGYRVYYHGRRGTMAWPDVLPRAMPGGTRARPARLSR